MEATVTAPPPGQILLTMPEAARAFGRSPAWVKARCDDGSLRHWLIRGRRWTTAAAIAEYLDRCEGHGRKASPPVVPAAVARADRAAAELLDRMGV